MIRSATVNDASAIATIYNYHVLNTVVTFAKKTISVLEMAKKIQEIGEEFPWLVFEESGVLLGYAYASSWKSRGAYKHTVESTIYVSQNAQNKGIGTVLYRTLMEGLKEQRIHVVIGGISLPNEASIALHEKVGFQKIGQFNEVGFKFGKWIDVGYWQLTWKE